MTLETPTPSRRTIPPISFTEPEREKSQGSGWIWVIGALWLAAMIPLGREFLNRSSAAGAPAEEEQSALVVPVRFQGARAVVPESAITDVEGKPTVFVAEPDLHLLVATPVELGAQRGADRELVAGIAPGQSIVADGSSARRRALAAR